MRERQTGLSQGFAFLEFTSRTAAQEVLNAFDGKQIPNTTHVLRLNWAAFGLGRNLEGRQEPISSNGTQNASFSQPVSMETSTGRAAPGGH